MNGVNLIPARRRAARQRRARLRVWLTVVSVYAALALVAAFSAHRALTSDNRGLSAQLHTLQREVAECERSVKLVGPRLAGAKSKLATAQTISRHPDWSSLLTVLARAAGDDVVLTGCQLTPSTERRDVRPTAQRLPATPQDGALPSADPQGYSLTLNGLAQSQAAVSQFVQRLEGVGLFDRVLLVKANREPQGSGEAVVFHIRCALGGEAPVGAKGGGR